jgi:hypothetical protein
MDQDIRARDIERLDQAWRGMEAAIAALGAKVREVTADASPMHRFEGYRAALAAIAENYANQLHVDRRRPEWLPTIGQLFNYGATNPDFVYRAIHLEQGASYRVWGRRGDGELLDVQQMTGWFGHERAVGQPPCITLTNQLFDAEEVAFDAEGNFHFILSPEPCDGAWWKLEPGTTSLLVRDYFTDYATQGRATALHADRLDSGPDRGATLPAIDQAAAMIDGLARALVDLGPYIAIPQGPAGAANQFREMNFGAVAGANDQRYFQASFRIRPGEALIGEWLLPEDYAYWGITLYTDAYQLMNSFNRQSNLNHALASVGDDGVFRFVISHDDPGVANWLDPDGHEQGLVMARTKGGKNAGLPTVRLVPANALREYLAADVARVTPDERALRLAQRRRHYQLRENC